MKNQFIILNLMSHSLFTFDVLDAATETAISMSKHLDGHPSFLLWEAQDELVGSQAKFMGRLVRDFGTDNFHWEINTHE